MTPGGGSGTASDGDEVPVVAAVVRRGDAYLLARRADHKRHGGRWEFPGGKVRDGESFAEALERELLEELDVTVVEVGETLFAAPDPGSDFVVYFVEVRIEGDPRVREHTEVRGVPRARLPDLALAPADTRFVREGLGADGPGRA